MLNGLTREVRWRDVTESAPSAAGWVLVAQAPTASMKTAVCRAAYWDGREFLDAIALNPIQAVTHWAPYPALPSADAMRRVFRELLGKEKEEMPC